MITIGFAGIGAMGEPMAANLLHKGFSVTVLKHRREEPANRLREQGAKVVTSPAALAASEVVVLCLPTSREVEATHRYEKKGAHKIRIVWHDDYGGSNSDDLVVKVKKAKPRG